MTSTDAEALQDSLETYISRFTVNILRDISETRAEAWASGVLIDFREKALLLSAAHILDNGVGPQLGIMHEKKFFHVHRHSEVLRLQEKIKTNRMSGVDIAIFRISDRMRAELAKYYEFYKLREVELLTQEQFNQIHCIHGYPITQSKMKSRILDSKTFTYHSKLRKSQPGDDVYFNHQGQIAITFDREKSRDRKTKNQITSPHPLGMSGCGVWRLTSMNGMEANESNVRLAGIFTHYFQKQKILVGSKLSTLIGKL